MDHQDQKSLRALLAQNDEHLSDLELAERDRKSLQSPRLNPKPRLRLVVDAVKLWRVLRREGIRPLLLYLKVRIRSRRMGVDHVEYPEVLPLACVQEVVRIVRSRKLAEEKIAFCEHAWNIQGYMQRVLIGTSLAGATGDVMSGCELTDEQLEECVGAFKEALSAAQTGSYPGATPPGSQYGAAPVSTADAQLNPAVVAILIQYLPMAIDLIRQLIAKRRAVRAG